MPIQLPNLDNKTYDDLMKEITASIPKYSKEWTNFNPSDPGITILELLAWISETLIYRTNRIPEESYINYLMLVSGSYRDEKGKLQHVIYDESDNAHTTLNKYLGMIENGEGNKDIQQMKAETQKYLNSRYRAVTEEDFEKLVLEAPSEIKRTKISTTKNVVEIVLIPEFQNRNKAGLVDAVKNFLKSRLLIGTVIDVKMAEYTEVNLKIILVCESYAKSKIFGSSITFTSFNEIKDNDDTVEASVAKKIFTYLDSIKGGSDRKGWFYGRKLMIYELFYLIEKVEGVKYIKEILESGGSFTEKKIIGLINMKSLEIEIKEESNE